MPRAPPTSPRTLRETVDKACSIARFTAEDPCAGLADPGHCWRREIPDLDSRIPGTLTRSSHRARPHLRTTAMAVDKRITELGGAGVSTHAGVRAYGNSHGFLGGYPGSRARPELRRDRRRRTRRCSATTGTHRARLAELEPAERSAAAARRAVGAARRAQARDRPRPGAVFAARWHAACSGTSSRAIRGGSQYREASFLLGAAGEQVFPAGSSSSSAPPAKGARQRAFRQRRRCDARSRPRDRRRAAGYVLGTYSARKLGLRTTGNAGGTHNLIVRRTRADFEAMLARMGTGLLVTELMGQGVNSVTGDYSRGAAGFWVEGGANPAIRSTRSRSRAISRTCTAASSTSATTSTCAAACAPDRS